MTKDPNLTIFKILQKTETRLIQYFFYIGTLLYLWIRGYGWWPLLLVHIIFMSAYGIIYFRQGFLLFFLAPVMTFLIPINNFFLNKYLKNFKQNTVAEVVIILGQSDYFLFGSNWVNKLKKD